MSRDRLRSILDDFISITNAKSLWQVRFLACLFFFGLVHIYGYGEAVGAKSWIELPFGIGNIQPSEVAKLIIIIYFSSVFANKYKAGTIDNLNQSIGPPILVLRLQSFQL